GRPVPEGAMDWPGASELSAESLVQQLAARARAGDAVSARAWGGGTPRVPDTAMAAALRAAGLVGPPGSEADADGDVLSDELEHEWFPATDWAEEARARGEVERAAARAA